MRSILSVFAVLAAMAPALAEETIIHREGPGPVPEPRANVTVEKHTDCASKTVHREDGAGDSTTVHRTNCD